jgi:hypothetical protein
MNFLFRKNFYKSKSCVEKTLEYSHVDTLIEKYKSAIKENANKLDIEKIEILPLLSLQIKEFIY